MDRRFKRRLAIAAVGIVAVAGGGAAIAATSQGGDGRDAYLNDVAKRLGVSRSDLDKAIQGAASDQIDQAVKDGRLTQQQADELKARIKAGQGLPFFGGPFFGGPPKLFLHHGVIGIGPLGKLDAAAKYLGLSDSDLLSALRSGKSLADVAKDHGKSVDGLEQAIVDAVKSDLDQAVKDGRLPSDKRDAIVKDLQARVKDLVQLKGFFPPIGGVKPWRGEHRFHLPRSIPAPPTTLPGAYS
jgi:hypothetical protein